MKKTVANNHKTKLTQVFLRTQIILLVLFAVLFVLISLVIYSLGTNDGKIYFYVLSLILALCDFIGGFYSGKKIGKNGLVTGLLFCLPINLFILLISFFVNSFKIDFTAFFYMIIVLVGSMLGGITSVNTKK